MRYVKPIWQYVLVEPFTWIFYYFFQPKRFKEEFEGVEDLLKIRSLLTFIARLILPIFLISYPLALLLRIILMRFVEQPPALISNGASFFLTAALGTLLGTISGFALGTVGGFISIIPLGFVGGITTDILFGASGGLTKFAEMSAIALIILGIEGFIAGSIIASIRLSVKDGILIGIRTGIAVLIAVGIAAFNTQHFSITSPSATVSTILSILEDVLAGLLLGVALDLKSGIILAIVLATVRIFTGDILTATGIITGVIFILSYIVGYYRLILYPFSAFSMLKAYFASRNNHPRIFTALQHSALYWDECEFVPLPYLSRMLLIAFDQDAEKARQEFGFIVDKRFEQRNALWKATLEIIIHDLERQANIDDIAKRSSQLTKFLSQEANLIDPQWISQLIRLHDASREAASYAATIGKESKRIALENMIWNLKRISLSTTFRETQYKERLNMIVNEWLTIARQEEDKLKEAPEEIGYIDNPYIAGPALRSDSSLFVGRRDLFQKLEQALNKGFDRPTFFLTGERRMGKTSTLLQLPTLLGTRYLPIFLDLQSPSILSSTAAFLNTLAEDVYKVMNERGMYTKRLDQQLLQEVKLKQNDAEAYYLFDEWLNNLEHMLEQKDRTLLLTFDEFESLEEAEQSNGFPLVQLLKWFRSVIQNRTRVALLFCGLQTFDELDSRWAGYFVNVQTHKVTFLKLEEAHRLIIQPAKNFPGKEIFGDDVIREIMQETGCHPFLIQALCSQLILQLNENQRKQASIEDIETGVDGVLETWSSYFHDLWERSDYKQRNCLLTLQTLHRADSRAIEQESGLDRQEVRQAFHVLRKRDLVILEDDCYRIATPIFSTWLARMRDN